jgi:hypothetical protein
MEILKVNSDTIVIRIKNANILVRVAGIYNILGRFLEIFRRTAHELKMEVSDPEFIETVTPKNIYDALLSSHRSNEPDMPLASLFQLADILKKEGNIRNDDYAFMTALKTIATPDMMQTSFPERKETAPEEGPLGKEDEPVFSK